MTAADLYAEADRRVDDAVTEGLDHLAKGWRPSEVAVVLEDAAAVVADLRVQAVEAEGREITESLERSNAYWATHERVEATA